MGQVTIYLDSETEQRLQAVVARGGTSKSRWIAELIREKTATTWPEQIKAMAGTWNDFPDAEEIRRSIGLDAPREPI